MNRIDTLKQISKMIASGTIPNDVYSKFLSECPIGFMQEKDLFNYLIGNDESKERATNYYLKTLAKNGSMPDEAVEMFNLLDGNK